MKIKKQKSIVIILIFLLALTYGFAPNFSFAASFPGVQDTISDSDPNAAAQSVTHTIVATTSQAITAGGYFSVVFPAGFTNIATSNVTCPWSGVAGAIGQNVTCTYASGLVATTSTITITSTTNPGTVGSYLFRMYTRQSGGTEIEKGTFRVAIIDDVEVSATVEATLTFTINGMATSSNINGVTTTGSSTESTLAFGTIVYGNIYTLGQQLNVTTNAASGFTVTVQQDGNLRTAGGSDIDSFDDGVAASTTPLVWSSPAGTLGSEATYGHFGLTALDSTLSNGDPFGASLYKGFYGTDAVEVMYHNGPADGATVLIGSSTVAYTIEINALQEAGDYDSILTYICTPRY